MAPFEGVAGEGEGVNSGVDGGGAAGGHGVCSLVKGGHCAWGAAGGAVGTAEGSGGE